MTISKWLTNRDAEQAGFPVGTESATRDVPVHPVWEGWRTGDHQAPAMTWTIDTHALLGAFARRYYERIAVALRMYPRSTYTVVQVALDTRCEPPGTIGGDALTTWVVQLHATKLFEMQGGFKAHVGWGLEPAGPADRERIEAHVAELPAIEASERVMRDAFGEVFRR